MLFSGENVTGQRTFYLQELWKNQWRPEGQIGLFPDTGEDGSETIPSMKLCKNEDRRVSVAGAKMPEHEQCSRDTAES